VDHDVKDKTKNLKGNTVNMACEMPGKKNDATYIAAENTKLVANNVAEATKDAKEKAVDKTGDAVNKAKELAHETLL
jgi:hypothetical protein